MGEWQGRAEQAKNMLSRREFIFGGAAIGATALTWSIPSVRHDLLRTFFSSVDSENYIAEAGDFLKDDYGLNVAIGPPENDHLITGNVPSIYERARALQVVVQEAGKYPPDFFTENSIHTVRLINRVKIGDLYYGGGYGGHDGTIGIGFEKGWDEFNTNYPRGVFHHEGYHIIEGKNKVVEEENDKWRDLHSCGCKVYREVGGREKYEGEAPSPKEWFISFYGQLNPIEDRAMFAQTLMIPSEHRHLLTRVARSDAQTAGILRRKIQAVKNDYLTWSSGQMNDKYWEDLLSKKVKYGYFAK